MAKTKKAAGTDDRYRQFLENLDLYALGLDSLSSRLDRAAYSRAMNEDPGSVISEITSRLEISEFDGDHFDISAAFTVVSKLEGQEALLSIEATFSAHFHPKIGRIAKASATRFANSEARLVFWPYLRQTVADITSRMHIRTLTIPLVFRT